MFNIVNMADDPADMEGCDQQKLADIIKGLHGKLRRELREANGDHNKVWQSHCTDRKSLEEYASAMYMLAVNHWTRQSPEGRVEWCFSMAVEFFSGGGLKKLKEKQKRRRQFSETVNKCCCCFDSEESEICPSARFPSVNGKLLLLDVGSCFNPFAVYDNIDPLAIDLQPAISTVYRCDFLNLEVKEMPPLTQKCCSCKNYDTSMRNPSNNMSPEKQDMAVPIFTEHLCNGSTVSEESSETSPQNGKLLMSSTESNVVNNGDKRNLTYVEHYLKELEGKEINILPSEMFHVVVFSLLLSYFPSASQRWECCQKAHQLLQTNGLLLIVTPDSSHQNKNSAMIKSWKTAIESLGFVRFKYEKQTHLHCMAFRKVAPCHPCNYGTGDASMMYIPQDFQEEEESGYPVVSHSEEDSALIMECFSELPDL